LALLGWNDGTDKELYTLEELVEAFDLNRVHKAAKIDPEKKQINHQHLIKQKDEDWRIPSLYRCFKRNYGT
jgi:glutamyl-tRNA synthetase